MSRAAAAAVLLLLSLASPSSAAERGVSIPGKLFEPERLEVLVGDTVTWRNLDAVTHTVTADDGTFDSGDLAPDGAFSVTFDQPGRTTYHCAIHRYMTGEVDVFALALSGPIEPIRIGTQFTLRGLARPGTESVVVERRIPGAEFAQDATVNPSPEGRFRVSLPAVTSADYRARAGTLESSIVHVSVSAVVTLRATSFAGVVRLYGSVAPAQPGMPVALQVYSRERFTWFPIAHARLDAASRILFTVSPLRTLHLRLALLRASGGLVGATSNAVLVRGRAREKPGGGDEGPPLQAHSSLASAVHTSPQGERRRGR
jgi:plastocyanin